MKKEKKTAKKKGLIIGLAIFGGIMALMILFAALLPQMLFTDYEGLPTTGRYEVQQASAILIDESRVESFETDGSKREIPTYFYYPDTDSGEFPLVIFSHGAFGYYESNTSTYMELASHGYVVISLDHPYHSFYTTDTNGKTITVNPEFMQQALSVTNEDVSEEETIRLSHSWLDIRVADINFVLDSVKDAKQNGITDAWFSEDEAVRDELADILAMTDTEKIGLMGHSLGGASSVTVGRTRDDIDAVIDIDGTMLGEELGYENGEYEFYEEAYPIPLLAMNNEEHHTDSLAADDLYVNNVVLENAVDSKYTYFKGSGHMNFTDLPLFSPTLAKLLGIGDADAEECIVTMNGLILDYYDCYLKDAGEVIVEECY